jgi:hypothetical protein
MVLKIKEIEFKDLSGNEILIDKDELCKILGNFIYVSVPDLRWLTIAQGIHSSGVCHLDDHERGVLKSLIESQRCGLVMAVKQGLINELG